MGYSLGSSAGVGATDEANNQSRIDWSITLYVSNTAFQYYYEYGGLDVTHLGRVWQIDGRHDNVRTGSNTTLAASSSWVRHDAKGELANIYTSGYYHAGSSSNGYGGPYATGDLSSSSGPAGTSNFNVSPKPPYYTNITRNADPTVFTIAYADTGAYNTGNAPTYTLEYAEDYNMSVGYGTMGSGQVGGFNANKTYYFRMYATNPDGTKYSGVYGPYWGQPSAPYNVTGTRSTTTAGAINVTWSKPTNVQSGIDYYHLYRNGSYVTQVNGGDTLSYLDTGLTRGSTHTYQVYAHTSGYWSNVSNTSTAAMAPGIPSIPGTPTVSSKVGRTLTLNSTRGSTDYGNTISEYRIQLSTDNGSTWKGWNNSTKAFTADGTYNTLDSSGNFTYQLLTPALTYRWRAYAVNSIGTGDVATTSSGTFVGAGGKRWDGSTWNPTIISKRYDGTNWVDLSIAKRFDGTNWVDLT